MAYAWTIDKLIFKLNETINIFNETVDFITAASQNLVEQWQPFETCGKMAILGYFHKTVSVQKYTGYT